MEIGMIPSSMVPNVKIVVRPLPWMMGYGVEAWAKIEGQKLAIIHDIQWRIYDMSIEALPIVPQLKLEQDAAQVLIDSLWDAGLRPTKGSGSAGSFEAQGKHLEDMRKLVFRSVSQETPK
jgi:hypothetical protein